jgi:ABC-type glycerol-3-phosphate transport system substrate-binding protein
MSPEDIKNGYVHDRTPLIEADPAFDRDDFYPAALAAASQEGGIYMVPRSVTVSLLSYNRDLWARRGVPAPKPDWTWADLIAAAEQLAEKRGDQVEIYGLVSWDSGFTALFGELAQAGINLFALPSDQVRLDRPEIGAALQRVAALAQSGAIYYQSPAESQSFNPEDMRKLILDQRAGMWSPEMLFAGSGEPQPVFEVGTAPLPTLGLPFVGSTEGYVMSSGTQHPEAAWRWLSFLSRQAVWRPLEGPGSISRVPARRSVAESSGYWKQLDAEAAAAVQAMLARPAAPPPPGAFDGRIYQPLSTALAAVVRGEQSAEQALTEAQAVLEQQIAQAQSTPGPVPAGGPIVVATPVPEVVPEGATIVTFGTLGFGSGQLRQIARTFNQNHPEVFVQIKNTDPLTGPVSLRDIASQVDCFAWWGPPGNDEFTAMLDLQPLIDADASANAGTPFLKDLPTRAAGAVSAREWPVRPAARGQLPRAGLQQGRLRGGRIAAAAPRLDDQRFDHRGAATDQRQRQTVWLCCARIPGPGPGLLPGAVRRLAHHRKRRGAATEFHRSAGGAGDQHVPGFIAHHLAARAARWLHAQRLGRRHLPVDRRGPCRDVARLWQFLALRQPAGAAIHQGDRAAALRRSPGDSR